MRLPSQSSPVGLVQPILTDEHPLLRTVSDPVSLRDPALGQNIADLAATLEDFRQRFSFGRAISAPQVGLTKRLIVMNLGEGPVALINPRIVTRSAETQMVWDDCLSVPGRLAHVERNNSIDVAYTDAQGTAVVWSDLPPDLSELLLHECDHLDGVLMTDIATAIKHVSTTDGDQNAG